MALILFDYDGVLADTLGDMILFAQQVCDELGVNHIVTPQDLNSLEIMSFATYGQQLGVPEHLVEEFVRRAVKKFGGKNSPPELFTGMDEVLKKLSARNSIAIVTGSATPSVKNFLAAHGLLEYVQAIYGLDLPGSKSEKILSAKMRFAKENENIYIVGDSISDIRAAKETDIKSIAVSWGHQSLEKLSSAAPDHIVHSPRELFETITKAENQQGS
jgi:HAD superfamily hydrolase (TIGR01549 family)